MGFKLSPDVNVVPFSVTDGLLSIYVGKEDIVTVDIPALKGYDIPKFCKQFMCPNVMAYAVGDMYGIVLRFDGTGCIFTKDRFLIKSFTFDFKPVDIAGPFPGGVFRFTINSNMNKAPVDFWIVNLGKKRLYLLQSARPWTLILDQADNREYFNTPGLGKYCGFPLMQIVKDKGMFLVDNDFKPYLQLNGELYESSGMLML